MGEGYLKDGWDSMTGSAGSDLVQTPSGEVNTHRGGRGTQLAAEIAVA